MSAKRAYRLLITAVLMAIKVDYIHGYGVPFSPSNLTIHAIRKHDVLIRWHYDGGSDKPVSSFEMTFWPEYADRELMNVQLLHLAKIEPFLRQIRLHNLHAGTMYLAYMIAVNDEGVSNRTENITFTTYTEAQLFHPVDTLVVLGVLCLWFVAVTAFLHRWGSIRIVQPPATRYKFKPKNLDTIRVCKRATDSVIYRNYSRQMSFTLEQREEKLERLNTLKRIELETEAGKARERDDALKEKGRVLGKDEKKHIMQMVAKKKRMKKEMKRQGKEDITRPRLMLKPGVKRGLPIIGRGKSIIVKPHSDSDLYCRRTFNVQNLKEYIEEEDEDAEDEATVDVEDTNGEACNQSSDNSIISVQRCPAATTELENVVVVEPTPSTSGQG